MEPDLDARAPVRDPLDTLPAELVLYLLRDFTFAELLPLLAVSSRWRDAALTSPGYWSYITLEARTEGAIDLFLLRLSRSEDRPVQLKVNLVDLVSRAPLPPTLRWKDAINALGIHLTHVTWLVISLPGANFPHLWPTLRSDAPKLRELHLIAGHTMPDGVRPVIPHDILSGNSCSLRSLLLFNVYLPEHPLAAFSQVSAAQLVYDTPTIVPNVFSHFPCLEYIHFPAFASFEDPFFHRPSSYNNIKVAFLRSGRFPLPMAAVRDVCICSVYNPRAHEIEEIFGQLQPPLECSFGAAPSSAGEQFELYAEELTGSERRRGFIDRYRCWSNTPDPALRDAVHTALSGRVHTLTVHAVNWGALMTCLGEPFSGLNTLRIYLSDVFDIQSVSLALPSRRHPKVVSLEAANCLALFDRAVVGLVGRVFEPQELPQTTLSLVNVHIVGAQTSIEAVFKDIFFEHHFNYTALLPPELRLHILRSFTFEQLQALLALCRRWRASALNSPAYWESITLDTITDGGVQLLLARLERSEGRPLELRLELWQLDPDAPSTARMQATVLSALCDHLHHVTLLEVCVRSDMADVWRALRRGAPLLCRIVLSVNSVDQAAGDIPVVPSDFMGGHAPLLRSIELLNVDLPPDPVPAFARVEDARIIHTVRNATPDVFAHFPRLRTISTPGYTCLEHPADFQTESYRSVTSCTWRSGRDIHGQPLPIDAARGVQSVTIYSPRAHEIEDIFGQLSPPFVVNFLPHEGNPNEEFEVSITELAQPGQRRRSIIDGLSWWVMDPDPSLTSALGRALAGKMQTLSIEAQCWQVLVQCVTTVPELRHLRIHIIGTFELGVMPHAQLAPIHLEVLEISASQCGDLSEIGAVNIFSRMFDPRALARARLVLSNIHVFDAQRLLSDLFSDVQFLHDARCNVKDTPSQQSYADVLASR